MPRVFAALLVLLAVSCGPARDPSLDEVASSLRATTPADQRTSLDADLDALSRLSRDQKLGRAERDALVNLFRSATKDGSLDEDEHALLVHLLRDLVAGSGSLNVEKT